MREQAVADHAGDLVDSRFEVEGVGDLQAVHIENLVAIVGDGAIAQPRRTPEFA